MDNKALALALLGMGVKGVGDYFGTKRSMDTADKKFEADELHRRESEKPAALKIAAALGKPDDEATIMNALSAGAGAYWSPTDKGAVKRDLPSAPSAGGPGKPVVDRGKVLAKQAELGAKMKAGTATDTEKQEFRVNNRWLNSSQGAKPTDY